MKDEQAFPCDRRNDWMNPGMTLRDYFAAKAMQGMMDSAISVAIPMSEIAAGSYQMADAMLKAREAK